MKRITKKEVIDFISKETNINKQDVYKVIKSLKKLVISNAKKNIRTLINGFIEFKSVEHQKTTGMNIRTGERVVIPKRKLIKAKLSRRIMVIK